MSSYLEPPHPLTAELSHWQILPPLLTLDQNDLHDLGDINLHRNRINKATEYIQNIIARKTLTAGGWYSLKTDTGFFPGFYISTMGGNNLKFHNKNLPVISGDIPSQMMEHGHNIVIIDQQLWPTEELDSTSVNLF